MSNDTNDRTNACSAQALLPWAEAQHEAHPDGWDKDAAAVLDLPATLRVALDAAHTAADEHGIRLSTTIHMPWPMAGGRPMDPWPNGAARCAQLIVGDHHMFFSSPGAEPQVELRRLRRSGTGLSGGSFVDADVLIDGREGGLEVTAAWEQHNGRWAPYGCAVDQWLSDPTVPGEWAEAIADAIYGLRADPADYQIEAAL